MDSIRFGRASHVVRTAFSLLAIGAIVASGPRSAGALQAPAGATLHSSSGTLRSVREMDALPRMTLREMHKAHVVPRPANGLTDAQYRALKERAGRLRLPQTTAREFSGKAPSFAGIGANTPGGRGFKGLDEGCSGETPSDMGLASGPSFVVQAVNSCIGVYNKNGQLQSGYPKSFNAFLGLPADAFTFDPRALFDFNNGRYILTIDQFDTANNQGFIWVAVSRSYDPRAGWNIYRLTFGSPGKTAPDFPTVGQDRQAIYVGANIFGAAGGNFTNFQGNQLFLLPKSSLYAGRGWSGFDYVNFFANGVTLDSLQPVNVSDTTSNPRAEFVLSSFNIAAGGGQCSTGCNGIVVFAISNPLAATGSPGPEISGTVVPTAHTYSLPPGARQSGGGTLIDTGDTRISGTTAYASGNVYGSLNTLNNAGRTSVLWFEVHPTLDDNNARCSGAFANACPDITAAAMLNEDCYFCNGQGTNGSSFYGTLQPDPEGNVTMVFAYSDDNVSPGVAFVSRRATQLANTMHDNGLFLSAGQGSYQQGRWGDYTGIALDQNSAYKWFSGMYSLNNGNWSTSIGVNGYNNPAQP